MCSGKSPANVEGTATDSERAIDGGEERVDEERDGKPLEDGYAREEKEEEVGEERRTKCWKSVKASAAVSPSTSTTTTTTFAPPKEHVSPNNPSSILRLSASGASALACHLT